MKVKERSIIMFIFIVMPALFHAQDLQRDKIDRLQKELSLTSDPDIKMSIREEIELLQADLRIVRESKEMDFERRLEYVRAAMIADDEQATVAMAHVKVDKALHNFLQTEFMIRYKDLKIEAESLTATFKAQTSQMSSADVGKVKLAYSRIAEDFNRFIVEIKRDFMDRKKLKVIRNNSEMYTNSLQYKLRDLKDSYSQNFERVVAEVTGSDMYAAVPIAAIFGMIKLAKELTDFFIRSSYEARKVKEEHLNIYLLEPYSLRPWYDIEALEVNMYEDLEMDLYEREEDLEEMDPFEYDVDAPSLSRKKP